MGPDRGDLKEGAVGLKAQFRIKRKSPLSSIAPQQIATNVLEPREAVMKQDLSPALTLKAALRRHSTQTVGMSRKKSGMGFEDECRDGDEFSVVKKTEVTGRGQLVAVVHTLRRREKGFHHSLAEL